MHRENYGRDEGFKKQKKGLKQRDRMKKRQKEQRQKICVMQVSNCGACLASIYAYSFLAHFGGQGSGGV